MDVDDCNVDCDFLAVVDLSFFAAEAAAASEPCSGDDDGEEEDASPPRMPHKFCESRNELCRACLSRGVLIAAAAVNTDAAEMINEVLERIALQICVVFRNLTPRSSRSAAALKIVIRRPLPFNYYAATIALDNNARDQQQSH